MTVSLIKRAYDNPIKTFGSLARKARTIGSVGLVCLAAGCSSYSLPPIPTSVGNNASGENVPGVPTTGISGTQTAALYLDPKGRLRWNGVDDNRDGLDDIFEPVPSVCTAATARSGSLGNIFLGAGIGAILGEVISGRPGLGAGIGAVSGEVASRYAGMSERERKQFWEYQCREARREVSGYPGGGGSYSGRQVYGWTDAQVARGVRRLEEEFGASARVQACQLTGGHDGMSLVTYSRGKYRGIESPIFLNGGIANFNAMRFQGQCFDVN